MPILPSIVAIRALVAYQEIPRSLKSHSFSLTADFSFCLAHCRAFARASSRIPSMNSGSTSSTNRRMARPVGAPLSTAVASESAARSSVKRAPFSPEGCAAARESGESITVAPSSSPSTTTCPERISSSTSPAPFPSPRVGGERATAQRTFTSPSGRKESGLLSPPLRRGPDASQSGRAASAILTPGTASFSKAFGGWVSGMTLAGRRVGGGSGQDHCSTLNKVADFAAISWGFWG